MNTRIALDPRSTDRTGLPSVATGEPSLWWPSPKRHRWSGSTADSLLSLGAEQRRRRPSRNQHDVGLLGEGNRSRTRPKPPSGADGSDLKRGPQGTYRACGKALEPCSSGRWSPRAQGRCRECLARALSRVRGGDSAVELHAIRHRSTRSYPLLSGYAFAVACLTGMGRAAPASSATGTTWPGG